MKAYAILTAVLYHQGALCGCILCAHGGQILPQGSRCICKLRIICVRQSRILVYCTWPLALYGFGILFLVFFFRFLLKRMYRIWRLRLAPLLESLEDSRKDGENGDRIGNKVWNGDRGGEDEREEEESDGGMVGWIVSLINWSPRYQHGGGVWVTRVKLTWRGELLPVSHSQGGTCVVRAQPGNHYCRLARGKINGSMRRRRGKGQKGLGFAPSLKV